MTNGSSLQIKQAYWKISTRVATLRVATTLATVLPMTAATGRLMSLNAHWGAGVRPQSKVASDCTLAPDPRPAGSTRLNK